LKAIFLFILVDQLTVHNPRIKKRLMIAPGEVDFLSHFSRAIFPVGETVQAHCHDDKEYFYEYTCTH